MIVTRRLRVATQGNNDVLNLTRGVEAEVASSGVKHGIVTVFVAGSTAGLTTVEYEPGLVSDIKEAFNRLVPRGLPYQHHLTEGDANGHSHVRAALIGPSLVVPFERGRLLLGTWQQVVLIDFDVRPRRRDLVVQIQGEA
jgi:secondary thiamine-phosphate synthase enzyme